MKNKELNELSAERRIFLKKLLYGALLTSAAISTFPLKNLYAIDTGGGLTPEQGGPAGSIGGSGVTLGGGASTTT